MNLKRAMTAGLLAICARGQADGAGPPLMDRPTPPACCADGVCYPNPTTWGSYPTRWRRWPTEALGPTADGVRPPGEDVGLPSYEAPPKEEEERSAPPPTRPAEERATETEATVPPADVPETTPLAPPGGFEPPPTDFPFDDDEPAEPTNGLPFGDDEISGDWDPPPVPPFGKRSVANAPILRAAERPASAPVRRPIQPSQPASGNDPPPALPMVLAGGAF